MRILLITVAGMSTRFSESVKETCLKCIYYRESIEESLLYKLLHQSDVFDRYILVGGFMYEELEKSVKQHFADLKEKIILIKNDNYQTYGSGYSLYAGLKEALKLQFDQLVFAEGDLYFDHLSFEKIILSDKNVITYNKEPVLADKAVAFYYDQRDQIHYIYDTNHNMLEIKEPFSGIYNSGQVWKFAEQSKIMKVMEAMDEEDWKGTNLVFIQKYFESISRRNYELIGFDKWINCNTIMDFDEMEAAE